MAKEIKINIRLIIDGKEQGCDLLKILYLCGDKDNGKKIEQKCWALCKPLHYVLI